MGRWRRFRTRTCSRRCETIAPTRRRRAAPRTVKRPETTDRASDRTGGVLPAHPHGRVTLHGLHVECWVAPVWALNTPRASCGVLGGTRVGVEHSTGFMWSAGWHP